LSAGGPADPSRRRAAGLGLLFGALAFCQAIGEPSDGLIAQPSWALLKGWGHGAAEVGVFAALVALPWSLKPVFGLLTDFVPLFGRRRQGYLVLAGGAATVSMFGLELLPAPSAGRYAWLLGWLATATFAWSFADVTADALLIDRGRASGRVGRFQAAQWAAVYAAGIIAGAGGGWLSEGGRERLGFWSCGVAATGTLLLASFAVREPRGSGPGLGARGAVRALVKAARSPAILGVGAFLFLWNFNPFSSVVLYLHATRTLGLDEAFYGYTQTLMAIGSILGCLAYPALARWVSPSRLVRLSIVLGVASTLAFAGVTGRGSAVAVSLVVGLTYMTATLIQLELAARACPPEAAGTVFALLMALENLAAMLSTALGGWCYQRGLERWGAMTSFQGLVGLGAASTAMSWLLLPLLRQGDAGGPSKG
jgi:MFS family permease